MFPMQGTWVWFLVGEIGSHMPRSVTKKKKKMPVSYRKQTYGYQRESETGINWEFGINRHTTIYKISNRDLLCSSENNIQ